MIFFDDSHNMRFFFEFDVMVEFILKGEVKFAKTDNSMFSMGLVYAVETAEAVFLA